MAQIPTRWTLEDLADFEQALASSPPVTGALRAQVDAAARGLEGAAARRAGLRRWLDLTAQSGAGARFAAALSLTGVAVTLIAALAGASAMFGMLADGGVNVVLFLAVLLGGQWLVLLGGLALWLARGRAAGSIGALRGLHARLALRLSGDAAWWRGAMDAGGHARAALLWRFARMSQSAGIAFNLGIIACLLGLVWVKNIGFHWESTTDQAMRAFLGQAVDLLAAPWQAWWPEAVPDGAAIDASRRFPGQPSGAAAGAWWRFLLMATLVWGMLPRVILWLLAWRAGHRALAQLDFQGRAHRALWRELAGTRRSDDDARPLDGVLVLDVGGSGLGEETLRPFLLRRLRVNPTSWHRVAVWDETAERAATEAISNAPAGIVLICEGWALSPARMNAMHADLRNRLGPDVPLKYLVVNSGPAGDPEPASPEEQSVWIGHVDSLRDPAAEVFAYEPETIRL
jgi:hypothetical protein